MSRRKTPPLPESPFSMGELVKFRTRDGAELTGTISLVGWMPFPGMYCFEVKTADGTTHKAPGDIKEIEKAEIPAPRIEKTAAGDQCVIDETPARTIPDAKLRPKKPQRESLTALEIGADDKQGSLF